MEEGEYLIRKGETTGALILVLEGSFKILSETNHGEAIVANGHKGNCFGNPDITRDTENLFSVVLLGSSRILELTYSPSIFSHLRYKYRSIEKS